MFNHGIFECDELPLEWYFVYCDADCIGEVLATSAWDAEEIAAGEFPDYPATEMYAIAQSEF